MRSEIYEPIEEEREVFPLSWYDWYTRELSEYYSSIKSKITQHLLEIGFDAQKFEIGMCDETAINAISISMSDLEAIWRGGE